MLSIYFGKPGCGKTTVAVREALNAARRGRNVYINFDIFNVNLEKYPNIYRIKNTDVGRYFLHDGVIIIDEATLFANSRDHKNFDKHLLEYIVQYRHYNVDIYLFSQRYNSVDLNIRSLATSVKYVVKGKLFPISRIIHVNYDIMFSADGDKLGEIIEGYSKPSFLEKHIFCKRCFLPLYWRYFDSWNINQTLPDLPRSRFLASLSDSDSQQ